MRMLHKLVEFSVPTEDLVNIFILYIRSVLEQSCQVWHGNLTLENTMNLERVQKNTLKIILKDQYIRYDLALIAVGLDCLIDRREQLCLKFAKSCLKNENLKDMFPLNEDSYQNIRQREVFKVIFGHTDRLKDSSIPYMQRLLDSNVWFIWLFNVIFGFFTVILSEIDFYFWRQLFVICGQWIILLLIVMISSYNSTKNIILKKYKTESRKTGQLFKHKVYFILQCTTIKKIFH